MSVQETSLRRRAGRRSVLGRLLGSEGRAKVLEALLLGTRGRFSVRQLARRLNLPATAVSRQLLTLWQLGLVVRERDGRRVYYQPAPGAAAVADLRALMLKLGSVVEALRDALARQAGAIGWAFVHGSVAAGTLAAGLHIFPLGVRGCTPLRPLF